MIRSSPRLLTVILLDMRNGVRGLLPSRSMRRVVIGGITSCVALLTILFSVLVREVQDDGLMLRSAASLIPTLLLVALGVALRGAAELDVREARTTMLLLSPLRDGQQLLAPFGTLMLLASLPFLLLLLPFLLAMLSTRPLVVALLLGLSALAMGWATVLAVGLSAALNARFGQERATRTLTVLTPLLVMLPLLLLRQLSVQGVLQSGPWALLTALPLPFFALQSMAAYRRSLFGTGSAVTAADPHWGRVPYLRLLLRSRYPWAMLGGPLILLAVWFSTRDFILTTRALTLFLLVSPTMGANMACLEPELQQPDRLRLAPLARRARMDMTVRVLLPITAIVAVIFILLGIWWGLPWTLLCLTALVPPLFFTYPGTVRILTAIYSSALALIVLFTPLFTPH